MHVVREDPHRKGLLFAGTENALYVSFDDGGRWQPLQSKLPHAPVYWLTVQEHFHDLVVGTYGRGFWILDDVTPLEQLTDSVRAAAVHLFEPRPAYRFRPVSRPNLAPPGVSGGQNGPNGATISYWLREAIKTAAAPATIPAATAGATAAAPKASPRDTERRSEAALGEAAEPSGQPGASAEGSDQRPASKAPVSIEIFDASGQKIRALAATNKTGMNRVVWDLRYEPTEEVRIRTTPAGNPHIWEEKRFRGRDRRGVYYYGIDAPKRGPLVAPGTYTVKIGAAGTELTQKLVVLKDPNSAGTEADVAASTKLSVSLQRDINASARMINQLEWTRRQLEELRKMLTASKADARPSRRPPTSNAACGPSRTASCSRRSLKPTSSRFAAPSVST